MKSEVQNKINKLLDSAAHHSYFDEAATLETLFQQINVWTFCCLEFEN